MRVKGQYILPKVLSTIGNAAIASLSGYGTSVGVYKMFRTFDELQAISDEKLRQTIRYALGKKYIKITHKNSKSCIELTQKGSRLVGKFAIDGLKPARPAVWDRQWRLIMFDIPESHKSGRDGFAANMKRLGLTQVQKSVFAFPYPCLEEVEVLADFHKVTPYLTCVLAHSITPRRRLERHFKLSK